MRIIRFGSLMLLLCLVALITSCQSTVPVYIKVTGRGVAEVVPTEGTLPPPPPPQTADMSWAEGDIIAIGHGVPPASPVSASQGKLLAKQAAKVDAQRNLLEQIEGVRVSAKTTVKNFMTESDVIHTQVDGLIAGAEVVSEQELDDGSFEVKLRLNMHPLARIIPPSELVPPPPAPPSGTIPGQSLTLHSFSDGARSVAQARLMAEEAAKKDGLRQILEQLKGVVITGSTTVENFMTTDDRIRARVEGIIRGARVVDTRYNEDGTVEVDMVLEHPDISQVVR